MKRLLCAFVATLVMSCGYYLNDIDRTQPNKIQKSVFQGEWFYRQTVIQVPYTSAFTFVGEQPDTTERIRWDIQEKYLIAWRTYDYVAGTDHRSGVEGDKEENTPIAIFPIEGHFDVQREYNAQTGEQTNVIVENSSDRPWTERRYMRVDWSQNLAANFNFLVEQVTQVPGSHYVQVPGDPDALLLGVKQGEGWADHQGDAIAGQATADYLDVVHRILAAPETVLLDWGDGTYSEEPACWYWGNVDCYPGEITVRSSFLKVDPANAYVARHYPDNEILRDENGDVIRVSYKDRDSLQPDPDGYIARASYFDKFGYFRTERDRYDRLRGETNSGRVLLINRFNIWKDAPGCVDEALAFPYADCTVKPIVYHFSPGFPDDMKPAAQETAREWNSAFKETVRGLKYGPDKPLDQVEDVFLLVENTFRVENGRVVDRGQRIGDLRYSHMYWVDEANQAGLLGYGPAATDPLTGEIISANAFVYGAAVDTLAQRGKDIIDLINDPNRLYEFIDGEDVLRDIHMRTADDPAPRERTAAFAQQKVETDRNKALRKLGKHAVRSDGSRTRSALARIKDTPLEQRLMSDPIIRALGSGRPTDAASDDDAERYSPRNWAMGQALRRERFRRQKLAQHRAEPMSFADPSIVGLAKTMKDEDPRQVVQMLRERIFRSTMEHEVGHTLGLRHNFEATSDALNYFQDYWGLRGEDGEALEPMTQAQIDGKMREYQYSSIMDYGSRFNSDIAGIGWYDKAAIAFGYGDLVYAFESGPDEPLLELYTLDDILRHYRHYTKLPGMFGGTDAMYRRHLVPHEQIVDQLAGRADWTVWEVPFRFCSDEYDGFTSTCAVFDEGADAYEIAAAARASYLEYFPLLAFARDRRGFSEWDYMMRVWERALAPMLTQYQHWVFDQFYYEYEWECVRSDDGECDQDNGNDARYYRVDNVPWSEADDAGLPGTAATRMYMDLLAEMIAQPEPGSYKFDDAEQMQVLWWYGDVPRCEPGEQGDGCSDLIVPFGTGRYTDSVWDYDSGYYFYDRLQMVGSFYDKLIALEAAVTSDTYFLGVDTGADVQRYSIGLNLLFPEEVHRLVGGPSTEDYPVFAGVTCDSDGSYHPPKLSDSTATPCGTGTFRYVDPATSFTVELYAIWYGMAFLPMAFDLDFLDRIKIWVEGHGEQIEVSDPTLLVTFTNPLNNRVYHATKAANPAVYSPGAALLTRAQRFADAYNQDSSQDNRWRLENLVLTIEDIRGTYDIYGYFWF